MPSEAYLAARDKIKAAKDEAQGLAKEAFETEARVLLDEMGIKSFSWTQYTPYFNDGDACVFGVNGDYPKINGGDEDSEDEEFEGSLLPAGFTQRIPYSELVKLSREEQSAYYTNYRIPFKKIADFLAGWESEDMLFMFGDHVEVTVTKDSIEVDDYAHD